METWRHCLLREGEAGAHQFLNHADEPARSAPVTGPSAAVYPDDTRMCSACPGRRGIAFASPTSSPITGTASPGSAARSELRRPNHSLTAARRQCRHITRCPELVRRVEHKLGARRRRPAAADRAAPRPRRSSSECPLTMQRSRNRPSSCRSALSLRSRSRSKRKRGARNPKGDKAGTTPADCSRLLEGRRATRGRRPLTSALVPRGSQLELAADFRCDRLVSQEAASTRGRHVPGARAQRGPSEGRARARFAGIGGEIAFAVNAPPRIASTRHRADGMRQPGKCASDGTRDHSTTRTGVPVAHGQQRLP